MLRLTLSDLLTWVMEFLTMAQVYRSYAAKEQEYAAEASLAHIAAFHRAAARKWIALAERSERFVRAT